MAVFKHAYKGYDGPLTPAWSRFLILPRYAFEEMRRKRFYSMFFLVSMLGPLICALIIYIEHNLSALKMLRVDSLIEINARYFQNFLGWQSMLAFFLAAFVGPGQISPDLANNALPLYLARPFSRTEYVLGKLSVLLILMSIMTWIPGLLLFILQAALQGQGWLGQNLRIANAIFFASWIWILLLSLLALALSAWVKWKPMAGGLLFGVFFVAAGFGGAINGIMRTQWGNLLNLSHLIGAVWTSLFEQPMHRGSGAMFFRVHGNEVPIWCCWVSLLAICAFCLYLLSRKIRGAEVVR
ncbi:MAG TPA: ABC transporter permease subunit [Bryobacteraceae bacterium]|jgi:ABC-2 type transport system permease protein|nr:ABC transporter permease subunit [Bryobacteraceae bacterium]